MCIIATAAKKRHMSREEVLECMRTNSDGFFMAALHPDGSRSSIRTLDQDVAIKFFDETVKEDDAFVMHARIPSRGAKTLENVHGWEVDDIMFMHNMTITEVDAMMKRVKWDRTDSEFFFRKVFIPFYRGLGEDAYKDGKFHEDLDNLIQHFIGYNNKFCFIMPDNKVIRYGNWVSEPTRQENGETAFYASNSGYKVYNRGVNSGKGGGVAGATGFCGRPSSRYGEGYDDYEGYGGYEDFYGYDEFGFQDPYGGTTAQDWRKTGKHRSKAKKSKPAKFSNVVAAPALSSSAFQGKVLFNLAGVKGMCELAVSHMVIENAIACRYVYSENETENQAEKIIRSLLPSCFTDTYDKVKEAFEDLINAEDLGISPHAVQQYVERFAKAVAEIYEQPICKMQAPYSTIPQEWAVRLALKPLVEKINVILRLLNVHLDFSHRDLDDDFVSGYVLAKDGSMMEKYLTEDLIWLDNMAADSAPDGVQMILSVINDCTEEYYSAAESQASGEEPEQTQEETPDGDAGIVVLSNSDVDDNEAAAEDAGTESNDSGEAPEPANPTTQVDDTPTNDTAA